MEARCLSNNELVVISFFLTMTKKVHAEIMANEALGGIDLGPFLISSGYPIFISDPALQCRVEI